MVTGFQPVTFDPHLRSLSGFPTQPSKRKEPGAQEQGQASRLLLRSLLLSEVEDLSEATLCGICQPRFNSPLTVPLPIM